MQQRIVNVSGGKDSTAVYLRAMENGRPFRAVFADTGNEHEKTYEYVRSLHVRSGGPQVEEYMADFSEQLKAKRDSLPRKWSKKGVSDALIAKAQAALVPSGNPFVDMCLAHGGFPGTRARFCTGDLKIAPMEEQVYKPLIESGVTPVVWLGLRKAESKARQHLTYRQRLGCRFGDYHVLRPILEWTLMDVFRQLAKHGIKANPLYGEGHTRVGCFPCIYAQKSEIELIAKNYPAHIDRIERWEAILNEASRSNAATFFNANRDAKFAGLKEGEKYSDYGIRTIVDWASTSRGGAQFNLIQPTSKDQRYMQESCAETGVCE